MNADTEFSQRIDASWIDFRNALKRIPTLSGDERVLIIGAAGKLATEQLDATHAHLKAGLEAAGVL